MANKDGLSSAMKYLSMTSQVGLSIAIPIILCLLAGTFLQRRFGLGQWVVLLALLLGLGGAASNLISFFNLAYHEAKQSEDAKKEE